MENKILTIKINSGELRKAVTLAGTVVPSNAIVPASETLLFVIKDKKANITATDTKMSVGTAVMCSEVESFKSDPKADDEMMIPFKFLSALLAKIPNQPITIDHYCDEVPKNFSSEKQLYAFGIVVTVGADQFEIPCENPEEFPKMPFKSEKQFSIDAEQLRDGLRCVKDFYIVDEGRPRMSGVILDMTTDLIDLVALQAHRGAVYKTKQRSETTGQFTLPDKLVSFLASNIKDDAKGPATVKISDRGIKVIYDNFVVISSLMTGDLVAYYTFLGLPIQCSTVLNAGEWRSAIDRAVIFSNDTGMIKHSFRDDKLYLKSENKNYQTASEQHINIQEEIESFDVNLKGKDIISGIGPIKGDVEVRLAGDRMPVYVVPKEHNAESLTFFFMPIAEI
jgi:DNA polymerase III sliding clamp (beta) subunit (PCNA family)